MSLDELEKKAADIEARVKNQPENKKKRSWQDLIGSDEDGLEEGCLICHL